MNSENHKKLEHNTVIVVAHEVEEDEGGRLGWCVVGSIDRALQVE